MKNENIKDGRVDGDVAIESGKAQSKVATQYPILDRVFSLVVASLSILLSLLPLFLFCVNKIVTVLDSDQVLIHLVFIFSAFAGILTEIREKQLSIDVFFSKLKEREKKIVSEVNYGFCIFTSLSLFISAFPNFFAIFDKNESVFYIPVRFIFLALPLMYVFIFILNLKKSKSFVTPIVAIILSFFASSSSIASIFYHLFGEYPSFAPVISDFDSLSKYFTQFVTFSGTFLIFFAITLTFLGLPIFISISFITYVAFSWSAGYVDTISMEAYHILTDSAGGIAAIPLFTMAGYILSKGSAGKRFLDFVKETIGYLPGGVVIATVLVITMFTTFTGASGVSILALGGILSTVLVGFGYDKDEAESLITASGAIGILFPPSLAIIIYSTTNFMDVSFMDMFKGAFIPGILMALGMISIGIFKGRRTLSPLLLRGKKQNNVLASKEEMGTRFNFKRAGLSFWHCFFELLLPLLIIGFIFSGTFNLLETASFTALYAFCLECFGRRDFSFKKALSVIVESVPIAGGVLVIIATSKGLAYFLVDANVPDLLTEMVSYILPQENMFSKYIFLFLLNFLLIIVGCIMDIYSAILVVSPLIIPVAMNYGISSVHTGVIFLTNLALGFLTPPIGMDLFIASYAFDKPVTRVIKKIIPYLLVQLVVLLLVTYIPWFSQALLD